MKVENFYENMFLRNWIETVSQKKHYIPFPDTRIENKFLLSLYKNSAISRQLSWRVKLFLTDCALLNRSVILPTAYVISLSGVTSYKNA
jgi:hypothetical protein